MLSKAIIFREMKSESGFSFAIASQPFHISNIYKIFRCVPIVTIYVLSCNCSD